MDGNDARHKLSRLMGIDEKKMQKCLHRVTNVTQSNYDYVSILLFRHYQSLATNISSLEALPPEVAQLILLKMPIKDILGVCSSSKTLAELCKDETLWNILAKQIILREGTYKDIKSQIQEDAILKKWENFRRDPSHVKNLGIDEKNATKKFYEDVKALYRDRNFEAIKELYDITQVGSGIKIALIKIMLKHRDWEGLTLMTGDAAKQHVLFGIPLREVFEDYAVHGDWRGWTEEDLGMLMNWLLGTLFPVVIFRMFNYLREKEGFSDYAAMVDLYDTFFVSDMYKAAIIVANTSSNLQKRMKKWVETNAATATEFSKFVSEKVVTPT